VLPQFIADVFTCGGTESHKDQHHLDVSFRSLVKQQMILSPVSFCGHAAAFSLYVSRFSQNLAKYVQFLSCRSKLAISVTHQD
jgi:hypothetical protein